MTTAPSAEHKFADLRSRLKQRSWPECGQRSAKIQQNPGTEIVQSKFRRGKASEKTV